MHSIAKMAVSIGPTQLKNCFPPRRTSGMRNQTQNDRTSILDKCGSYIRKMPYKETKRLTLNRDSHLAQRFMKYLKINQYRVKCPCNLISHVVIDFKTQKLFLRRNPNQGYNHYNACPFCNPNGEEHSPGSHLNYQVLERQSLNRLLLNVRNNQDGTGLDNKKELRKKGGNRLKYAKMFSFLFSLFEVLGINEFPNPILQRNAVWDAIYFYLQNTPYGKFCWCPSKECNGGLVALNKWLKHEWPIKGQLAEGILLGVVDDIPEDNRPFSIMKFPKDRYPVRGCKISRRGISIVGDSGPYVMFAVCIVNNDISEYAVPNLSRMVMHSILSWKYLIPVNSDYEREIVRLLIKDRIRFIKPLFDHGKNHKLKQGFILPDRCTIHVRGIEMRGKMNINPSFGNPSKGENYLVLTYS